MNILKYSRKLETMKIKYNVEDIKQTCIDNINEHDLRERRVSRVVKLRRLGLYFHEIAKETGWDESTIKRYYHERNY